MSTNGNPWKNLPGMLVAWLKNERRKLCDSARIDARLKCLCRRKEPMSQYAKDWLEAWRDILAGR